MELVFNDPIILDDDNLLVRPLQYSDRNALATFAFDPNLWEHSVYSIASIDDLDWFLRVSFDARAAGLRYPLCILLNGKVVGTTSYGSISVKNCKLEIGWTWIARIYHGSGLNYRVKNLLIDHAFFSMNCERIEFQTDVQNLRARKSIEKLGATLEGILRSHIVRLDGKRRDSAVYSILKAEWLNRSVQLGKLVREPVNTEPLRE